MMRTRVLDLPVISDLIDDVQLITYYLYRQLEQTVALS
jgi:hypothetical protein